MQINTETTLFVSNNLNTGNSLNIAKTATLRGFNFTDFQQLGYDPNRIYFKGDIIGYNGGLFMSPTGDYPTGVLGSVLGIPGQPGNLWLGDFGFINGMITVYVFNNSGSITGVPSNVRYAYVTGCGGGGGGGGSAGGAGAGGVINQPISNFSNSFTIVVGNGGTGAGPGTDSSVYNGAITMILNGGGEQGGNGGNVSFNSGTNISTIISGSAVNNDGTINGNMYGGAGGSTLGNAAGNLPFLHVGGGLNNGGAGLFGDGGSSGVAAGIGAGGSMNSPFDGGKGMVIVWWFNP